MKVKEIIPQAYENVRIFNALAGNLGSVDDASITAQIEFIHEEMCEAITGFELENNVELLDGVCDVFVTVAGLRQKLVKYHPDLFSQHNFTQIPYFSGDVLHVDDLLTKLSTNVQELLSVAPYSVTMVNLSYRTLQISISLLCALENEGYNVVEALTRVNSNNMSKFPEILSSLDREDWNCAYNEEYERWVLKNGVGKIMKPRCFAPVDIYDCVPK